MAPYRGFSSPPSQRVDSLILTGVWGSGKTYHVKNYIFPKIESETEYIPIIVSLYGETDKSNIAQKVLFAFFDKKGKNSNLSTGIIAKNIKNFTDAIPIIKKYVDVEKLITGTGENIFKFLPHDRLLICFDDVERMSEKINVNDFLGIVNELVENKGCKVLLIANEEEIKDGISFKEKTIEKTIHFSPNISSILDSIIDSYEEDSFKKYLKDNKNYILKTLKTNCNEIADEEELKKSFSNIRTLKFSIEHFKYSFSLLLEEKSLDDDIVQKQLKSLWLFTLSISAEFKKPNNITFNIRKNLDKRIPLLPNIELNGISFGNVDKKEEIENDWVYSNRFNDLYYKRLSELNIFYPGVYDLITSGKAILKKDFLEHLEKSFNVENGKIPPAYELLNAFIHKGYWTFSNEEFPDKLKKLLEYAENGQFGDIVSYLNAGYYLINFIDLFDSTKVEIATKIKVGIEIFISKNKVNYLMKSQFKMVSNRFDDEYIIGIVAFIKQKLKEKEDEQDKQEAKRLEHLFNTNIEEFVKEFLPDNSRTISPDKPYFHEFDNKIVKESIAKWEPQDITNFTSLLKIRYLNSDFSGKLIVELNFIETLNNRVNEIDLNEKKLSNYIIKNQLIPTLIECRNILNQP